MMTISADAFNGFYEALSGYYSEHGRHDMPWRQPSRTNGKFDPYKIMVSELMLQQTQVSRVTPKYLMFLERFPTVRALAAAPLAEVLTAWSGLGYNRRAKFLWQAAQLVVEQYAAVFPDEQAELQKLPGIGPNTAGAIMAYAYDAPVLFVETNIRTVIIHHFFDDQIEVADKAILEILAEVMPRVVTEKDAIATHREFYWAMMDYGAHLKKTVGNMSRFSQTYAKQSTFQGSKRQLRGQVLRLLADRPQAQAELQTQITDTRLNEVLAMLTAEGLISRQANVIHLGH